MLGKNAEKELLANMEEMRSHMPCCMLITIRLKEKMQVPEK